MGTAFLSKEESKTRRRARSKAWKDRNKERVQKYRRDRYEANVEAALEKAKKWYEANKEYALAASAERQLSRFGLTLDDYKELLDHQGGNCAICNQRPEEGSRRLAVDHNHGTQEIRGLLCVRCNTGLGQFLENPILLRQALAYLDRSPTRFKLPRPLIQNPRRKAQRK